MAIADFKDYFYKMERARFEAKNNLADFEEAVKNGNITEDRLAEVKRNFEIVDTNYQRTAYIWFILKKRKSRRKVSKADELLAQQFAELRADLESVEAENSEAIDNMKTELVNLTKKDGEDND